MEGIIDNNIKQSCSTCDENIMNENKLCKYCNMIYPKTNFRHNRLKCHECEKLDGRNYRKSDHGKKKSLTWVTDNRQRMSELQSNWYQNNKEHVYENVNHRKKTDFAYKFIINQRHRIRNALKNKQKKTIEYLGCNGEDLVDWMKYLFNDSQILENHGSEWHIDHVIPISNFNIDNENDIMLCLNWRNTMPLSVKENLSKNKKIISSQVEQHLQKLISYHKEKNIELPQEFIDLFTRHLVVRETPESLHYHPYMETHKGNTVNSRIQR